MSKKIDILNNITFIMPVSQKEYFRANIPLTHKRQRLQLMTIR